MSYLNLLVLILIMTISSCGLTPIHKNIVNYKGYKIDKEFIPHVIEFERHCKKEVKVDILMVKAIPGAVIGLCYGIYVPEWFPYRRTIYIDKEWWDEYHYLGALGEELIFHELGHCVLDRLHISDLHNYVDQYQRPKSIMYPSIFGYFGWYINNREEYIKELCEGE